MHALKIIVIKAWNIILYLCTLSDPDALLVSKTSKPKDKGSKKPYAGLQVYFTFIDIHDDLSLS